MSITKRTLCEHIAALQAGEYSSLELTTAITERIKSRQKLINAYITTDLDRAICSAKASDIRRAEGRLLSPIDGIPYAIKDNISTKGLRTTCGSKMLENYIPPYDATLTEQLNACGAVLLGKTNLDEFAMGVSTETSYFGPTLNPLDTSRVAGGSSGGSAAAVADGQAVFAIGSDTGGSVRQPAAFCGVVGLRPTYGALSRYGLISFAPSLDQIGIISSSVVDNALLSSLLFRQDNRDETSVAHPNVSFNRNKAIDLHGLKVGILGSLPTHGITDEVWAATESAALKLEAAGAAISYITLPHADGAYAAYYTIACAEASSNLARFDGVRYGHRAKSCNGIEELYESSRTEGFGAEVKRRILFGTMALSSAYRSDFYTRAVSTRQLIAAELSNMLDSVDILLLPTAPTVAYHKGGAAVLGFEAGTHDIFCTLAALAGLPALSIPVPTSGMPIGIQLMGRAFSEQLLFSIGTFLEGGAQ